MAVDFYGIDYSPPCRAVLLLMAAINLTPNMKEIDLMAGDHTKPDFTQLSPQHTIPTIVDNGFTLTESRAIMKYLVEKYGKDSGLIPENIEERAVMNQMLDFDLGTVMQRFAELYMYPIKFKVPPMPQAAANLDTAMLTLDLFLEGQDWVAGNKMTVADFSYAATIATLTIFYLQAAGYDITPYKNIQNWYNKAKSTMKGWDTNEGGAAKIGGILKAMKTR
uniref:Glutathione S-transferase 1, isoform D n=1 Tax=Cacopsylla melanoneura TaxID=428564 RepID=A0A8D8XA30_9HEMI